MTTKYYSDLNKMPEMNNKGEEIHTTNEENPEVLGEEVEMAFKNMKNVKNSKTDRSSKNPSYREPLHRNPSKHPQRS